MNWALQYPVRQNVNYQKLLHNDLKFPSWRMRVERYDTKSNVKLGGFQSQLEVSCVSSHTEELWYNETVCLCMTIYIRIYIYIYIRIYIYIYIVWIHGMFMMMPTCIYDISSIYVDAHTRTRTHTSTRTSKHPLSPPHIYIYIYIYSLCERYPKMTFKSIIWRNRLPLIYIYIYIYI